LRKNFRKNVDVERIYKGNREGSEDEEVDVRGIEEAAVNERGEGEIEGSGSGSNLDRLV